MNVLKCQLVCPEKKKKNVHLLRLTDLHSDLNIYAFIDCYRSGYITLNCCIFEFGSILAIHNGAIRYAAGFVRCCGYYVYNSKYLSNIDEIWSKFC